MESGARQGFNLTHVHESGYTPANRSIAFLDLPNIKDTSIANSFVIYKDDKQQQYGDPFVPHSAIEILFYWCVGEHVTEVKNGIPSSNPIQISTNVKTTHGNITTTPEIIPNPLMTEAVRLVVPIVVNALVLSGGKDKEENYMVDITSNGVLSNYLFNMMNGESNIGFTAATSDSAEVITSALYDPITIGNVSETMTLQQAKDLQIKTVDTIIANIATSLSNK